MKVVDNFGVCEVFIIKVLGGSGCKIVNIGDVIVCIVKNVILGGVVKKGDVVKVVIVCIKLGVCCNDGLYIKFDENVCVIICDDKGLCGICIFGFVVCELCEGNFMKIVLLVLEVF